MRTSKNRNVVLFILGVLIATCSFVSAQSLSSSFSGEQEEIHMIVGDVETIWTKGLTRISITKPNVADALKAEESEILMIGKSPGKTDVLLWDKYGKRSIRIWVFEEGLDLVEERIKEIFMISELKNVDIQRNALEGKIVLTGGLEKERLEEYKVLVEPFASSIIDLVKEEQERELIEIDIQFTEMSTSFSKNFGIEWTNADGKGFLNYLEDAVPSGKDSTFRVGHFERVEAINTKVNALISEGNARVLSKPKIVARSGEEASFQVGGEIPVSTTSTSSGGNVSENVDFEEYGIMTNIKATVKEDDKIDIELKVEVRDIDSSNQVGDNVAYTTRNAETKLFLNNNQTIVMAGFIKQNEAKNISRIPVLSDIPLLGVLFRNTSVDPKNETELFITITPRIIARRGDPVLEDEPKVLKKTSEDLSSQQKSVTAPAQPTLSAPRTTSYSSASVPGAMAGYVRNLQQKIAQRIIYPDAAKASYQQGTVSLDLSVHKNGALLYANVKESSGYPALDQAALKTVEGLSPYGEFPREVNADKLTITIPIVYRLE